MRARLRHLGNGTLSALDPRRAISVGSSPTAHVRIAEIDVGVVAVLRYERQRWRVLANADDVCLLRDDLIHPLDEPLEDGDVLRCRGVDLVFEAFEDAAGTAFLVLPTGFAREVSPDEPLRIGDGADFDVRVRLSAEGLGCVVGLFDDAWCVSAIGDTPVWTVAGGTRTRVKGREPLHAGSVIDLDEALQIEVAILRGETIPVVEHMETRVRTPRMDEDSTAPHAPARSPSSATPSALAPTTRTVTVERTPTGVFMWTDVGEVGVDLSQRDFALLHTGQRVERYGATRAGLSAVKRVLMRTLRPRPLDIDTSETLHAPILETLAALTDLDDERAALLAEVRVRVDEIEPTPLLFSRAIVGNMFLLRDAVRFMPCAAALASIERDGAPDADTPEQAEIWADRLSRWRDLYVAKGSAPRSVNKSLSDYGEDITPRVLWGLRKVPLSAPLPSRLHMELLCALGSSGYFTGDVVPPAHVELVLRSTETEIGEALVILDEGELPRIQMHDEAPSEVLAGMLATIPLHHVRDAFHRVPRLPDAFALAVQRLGLPLRTETLAPPIPLPSVPGLRFLETIADIVREGDEMGHCGALYGPRAVAGACYLFHYDDVDSSATIEVSSAGVVTQARGHSNRKVPAARRAERLLSRWGRPLRLTTLGAPTDPIWREPGPALPAQLEAVRTIAEAMQAYRLYVGSFDDDLDIILDWVMTAIRDAIEGTCWLARGRGVGAHLWRIELTGSRSSSEEAFQRARQLGRGAAG